MEADKIPEKIYVSNYSSGLSYNWHPERLAVKDIEYTRTDAFIEKTVNWLKHSLDNGCWIANDVGEQEKDAIIEHFKETMKLKE